MRAERVLDSSRERGINSPGSYGSTRTNSSGALGDRTTSSQAEDATLRGRNRNTPFVSDRPSRPDPPTEFQKYIAEITGQRLPIYGANLFRNVPSTFSPNELSPVTSNYIVGPEDELRVRIWGQITYSGNLRVDRSGRCISSASRHGSRRRIAIFGIGAAPARGHKQDVSQFRSFCRYRPDSLDAGLCCRTSAASRCLYG